MRISSWYDSRSLFRTSTISWNEMLAWLRQKRWQSMSFGGSVYLVLLVPVVNLLMMPAAVAGATLFWVREQGAETALNTPR